MVRTSCPSISEFRLGFSFPSFGSGGTSFGDILWTFFSVTVFFSSVCLVSFGCGYGCHALAWILCRRFSFLPFRLDLSGLGVVVPSQSLQFLCFWSDLLFLFLLVFLRPPGSGVLRRSCSLFFLFEVFLSAFEVTFSCPFFLLGVEVWLGPSVFSPELRSLDSSFGSGKIRSSVFVWAV